MDTPRRQSSHDCLPPTLPCGNRRIQGPGWAPQGSPRPAATETRKARMTVEDEQDEQDEAVSAPVGDDAEDEAAEAEETADAPGTPADEHTEASSQGEPSLFGDDDRRKKVEQSFATYTKSLSRNYEEEANDLIRCPLCPDNFPGFVHPNDFGHYPEEVKTTIMGVLGLVREQDYAPDPTAIECSTCRGKGKVGLPSSVAGQQSRECPLCHGAGWLEQGGPSTNGVTEGVRAPALALAVAPDIQHGETDEWGEPRILPDGRANPNYGKLPQHKVTVEPFGITRLLTQQG